MAGSTIVRLLASQGQFVDLESNQIVSGTKLVQLLQTPQTPTVDNDVVNKITHDLLLNYTSGVESMRQQMTGTNPELEAYASGIETMRRNMTTGSSNGLTRLTENLVIYVNSDTGSDSINDGTSGSPFATIAYAANYIAQNYDIGNYKATVKLYDGIHILSSRLDLPAYRKNGGGLPINYLSGCCVIEGSPENPMRTHIYNSGTGGAFYSNNITPWVLKDFLIEQPNRGFVGVITAQNYGLIGYNNLIFRGNIGYCFNAISFAAIVPTPTQNTPQIYIQAKDVRALGQAIQQAFISTVGVKTVFMDATVWITGFAWCEQNAVFAANNTTFSGASAAVTGPRYKVALNGVIYTNTNNVNFFPGSTGGSDTLHQQYY